MNTTFCQDPKGKEMKQDEGVTGAEKRDNGAMNRIFVGP